MDSLVESMIKKRLCLPVDITLHDIVSGEYKSIIKHDISHVACLFKKKGSKINVVSYGYNNHNNMHIKCSTHAEKSAIDNIKIQKSYIKALDLIVVRTSPTGKIGSSKPCVKCLIDLCRLPKKKNYYIRDVYYSDERGEIQCKSLIQLIEDGDFHLTQFYANNNFEYKKWFK